MRWSGVRSWTMRPNSETDWRGQEMKRGGSRIMRVQPETWERARALYPAPPEVKAKPDDVIGYVLDLAEQQRGREAASDTE